MQGGLRVKAWTQVTYGSKILGCVSVEGTESRRSEFSWSRGPGPVTLAVSLPPSCRNQTKMELEYSITKCVHNHNRDRHNRDKCAVVCIVNLSFRT